MATTKAKKTQEEVITETTPENEPPVIYVDMDLVKNTMMSILDEVCAESNINYIEKNMCVVRLAISLNIPYEDIVKITGPLFWNVMSSLNLALKWAYNAGLSAEKKLALTDSYDNDTINLVWIAYSENDMSLENVKLFSSESFTYAEEIYNCVLNNIPTELIDSVVNGFQQDHLTDARLEVLRYTKELYNKLKAPDIKFCKEIGAFNDYMLFSEVCEGLSQELSHASVKLYANPSYSYEKVAALHSAILRGVPVNTIELMASTDLTDDDIEVIISMIKR